MGCIDINKDKCDLVHGVSTVDYCQVSGALSTPSSLFDLLTGCFTIVIVKSRQSTFCSTSNN